MRANDQGNFGSGGVLEDFGTVSITVRAVNDPPTANADALSMAERHPTDSARPALTVAASVLTNNDVPGSANENTQTIQIVPGGFGNASQGSVAYDGTNVIYTPPAYFNGQATFTYTITDDGVPAGTAVGTVTVTVTAVNDPPVPLPDADSTREDTAKTLTAIVLVNNDARGPVAPAGTLDNETSQILTLVSVDPRSAAGGTVTLSSGIVTYTPPANFNGPDTLTYRVRDNGLTNGLLDGRDATGTVTITVLAVNDGPQVATPLSLAVNEDQMGPIAGISVSDIDVGETPTPGGRLTVSLSVAHGLLTLDTTVNGGLTADDIVDNGKAAVSFTGTPQQINATLAAANGLAYKSAPNFNGKDDTLVVTVDDGGQTGTADPASPRNVTRTVTVTVNPMNDPPQVTVPNGLTVPEDASGYFGAIQVSDVDAAETAGALVRVTLTVDNGKLEVSPLVSGGLTGGNISNNNSRSVVLTGSLTAMNKTLGDANGVRYLPATNFSGSDTVNVTVSDQGNTGQPGEQTSFSTFTISVTPANDVPSAVNDPGLGDPLIRIDEDTVLQYAGRGVLANDIDVDGDDLDVVIEGLTPVAGKYHLTSSRGVPVVIDAEEGTFTFDPTGVAAFQQLRSGQTLTDTFAYKATDGIALSNLATVTITVTGVNDAPVAGNDTYTVADNGVLESGGLTVPGLLVNDKDPENEALSLVVASSDSVSKLGAVVTLQTNGEFTYDPRLAPALASLKAGDPAVTDTFNYVVADASGL